MNPVDENFLRRAFTLASDARTQGHRPFGAVIADASGVICDAGSTQGNGDVTAHAEMNVIRRAMQVAARERLSGATLYASTEPCAMCAASAFYAGLGRIVFGFPEAALRPLRNRSSGGAGVAMSSREALGRATRATEVIGPCLEEEAAALHQGFWSSETR